MIASMSELSLRPMTQPEFERWRQASCRAFADEQAAAGSWPPDEAFDRALQGSSALLPQGLATPGMFLLMAVRPDGATIGRVWVRLSHPQGLSDCAYLYDIEVDEEHRGAGYGRALLAAVEETVREHGVGRLELNVFGGNARAIRLYERAGYVTVSQQMRKNLRS